MKNWILLLVIVTLGLIPPGATAATDLSPKLHSIPGAPGVDTGGSSLYRETGGTLHHTWSGPGLATGERALWHATLSPAAISWSTARPIVSSPLFMENWADFATLTVGTDGTLWAQWFQNRGADQRGYDGWFARSTDEGQTWSVPDRLGHEFVSLAPLSGGRIMAVWLESTSQRGPANAPRVKKPPHAPYAPSMRLVARLLGPDGEPRQDWVIDPDVCTCCQTTITALPDDRLVVAYRGHTPAEIRDNLIATFYRSQWSRPSVIHADNWHIAGCPVNGPAIDARGETVAVTWFTAANGISRVLAKFSPDGGRSFGEPLAVDLGKPMGRLDLVSLSDGSAVVSWIETATNHAAAGLYVRRLYPDGTMSSALRLGTTQTSRTNGFARMAVRDFPTDTVAISYTDTGPDIVDALGAPSTRIRTTTFSAAYLLPAPNDSSPAFIHHLPVELCENSTLTTCSPSLGSGRSK